MSGVGIALSVVGTGLTVGALGAGVYAATGGFGSDAAKAAESAAARQAAKERQAEGLVTEGAAGAQAGLAPYQQAGTNALRMQQALAGALGPEAQAQAYQMLQDSPAFAAMMQQGERSLLANASATGGLRGGNAQRGLAEMGPQVLAMLAQQQGQQLAGLSGMGLSAAGQSGQFGLAGAGQAAGYRSGLGAIEAGGILGKTQAELAGRQQALGYGLQAVGTIGSLAAGGF